jgi:hypothetical protein
MTPLPEASTGDSSSSGEPPSPSGTGPDTTTAADDTGSEGSSSTGEPEPLPCINIEPADDDVCYVEHVLEPSAFELALSDQDGDGLLDLVLGKDTPWRDEPDPDPSGIWILHGNPDGTFGEPQLVAEIEGGWTWMLPLGPGPDGVSRMITERGVDAGFLVVPEYGVVVGESFVDGIPNMPGSQERDIEAADVDGDGVLEFVGLDPSDDMVHVGFGGSGGVFEFIPHELGINGLMTLAAGDEDGDGRDDLLVLLDELEDLGSSYQHTFRGAWSHAQPGGDLDAIPPADTWSMLVGLNLHDPRLVDVDGDGILDVFARYRRYVSTTSDSVRNRLVIARGIEGGFEEQVETELDDTVLTMEPMDLDQDGLVDAVVRHDGAEDELWLMRLTDSLSFELAMRLGLTHTPLDGGTDMKLAVADLNADGHDDFVTLVQDAEYVPRVVAVVSRPE